MKVFSILAALIMTALIAGCTATTNTGYVAAGELAAVCCASPHCDCVCDGCPEACGGDCANCEQCIANGCCRNCDCAKAASNGACQSKAACCDEKAAAACCDGGACAQACADCAAGTCGDCKAGQCVACAAAGCACCAGNA